ncbi:MAG: tRNA modification GTPase, partial [Flavobacteriales bacterium]|nr:tRNA modification GTPase [Flavobacteriales bacterium]
MADKSCICAISTAPGMGAIAVIRVSGEGCIALVDGLFSGKLREAKSHTALFGRIIDQGKTLDEVLATVFHGPNSFTGEDTVEIACHGSNFIQQELLRLLLAAGCRMAEAGEFTLRAFLNGKMDLSQAEAVADLISSESAGSHALAMHQMRGGFSKEIADLRERLIHFASLIELELDFAEEDVEFADRLALVELIDEIKLKLRHLIDSFAAGNVIKNGVPVAILGAPNRGKSTLLNVLLNEERAIVSAIAGTTRDTIEDEITIEG